MVWLYCSPIHPITVGKGRYLLLTHKKWLLQVVVVGGGGGLEQLSSYVKSEKF
jgi:hypothetical protein